MSETTAWFGIGLVAMSAVFYFITGNKIPHSLIPAAFGVLFMFLGQMAASGRRRKITMHVAALLGLIGLAGALVLLFTGKPSPQLAIEIEKTIMAALMFIFLILCIRSFISARRLRA